MRNADPGPLWAGRGCHRHWLSLRYSKELRTVPDGQGAIAWWNFDKRPRDPAWARLVGSVASTRAGPPEVEALGVGAQPSARRHLGSHHHPEHCQHVEPVGVGNITPGSGTGSSHRRGCNPRGSASRASPRWSGCTCWWRVDLLGTSRVVKSRERLHPRDVNGAAEVPIADRERRLRVRLGQHDVVPLDD